MKNLLLLFPIMIIFGACHTTQTIGSNDYNWANLKSGASVKLQAKTYKLSAPILIENKDPLEIEREIDEGKYDSEISQEKTETSEEKKKILEEYFSKVKSEQEKIKQQEEAAAAAEAAAKEEKPEEKQPEAEEKPEAEKKDKK